MSLRAGDLVTLKFPFVSTSLFSDQPDVLEGNVIVCDITTMDVALVISLSSYDAKCVYIAGPHGCGWAFGAHLKQVMSITK